MVRVGTRCREMLDQRMRHLELWHLELDEIWTFTACKQGHLSPGQKDTPDLGDQFLYVALDRDTKLIPSFTIGKRNRDNTEAFLLDLANWFLRGLSWAGVLVAALAMAVVTLGEDPVVTGLAYSAATVLVFQFVLNLLPILDLDGYHVLVDALDAPRSARTKLSHLLHALNSELSSWESVVRSGMRRKQDQVRKIEAQASVLKVFQPAIIPGLLQTADYARKVFEEVGLTHNAKDVEEALAARLGESLVLGVKVASIGAAAGEGGARFVVAPEIVARVHAFVAPDRDVGRRGGVQHDAVHQEEDFVENDREVNAQLIMRPLAATHGDAYLHRRARVVDGDRQRLRVYRRDRMSLTHDHSVFRNVGNHRCGTQAHPASVCQ